MPGALGQLSPTPERPSLAALDALVGPPPAAEKRRYRLQVHCSTAEGSPAPEQWQAEVSRAQLRHAVGAILRWLRHHYPSAHDTNRDNSSTEEHSPAQWQLACYASTAQGTRLLGRWRSQGAQTAAGSDFAWLADAARRPNDFSAEGIRSGRRRGPERRWPRGLLPRPGRLGL